MASRKHPARNVFGEHRRNLIKILDNAFNIYSRSRYDSFRAFAEYGALSLHATLPEDHPDYQRRMERLAAFEAGEEPQALLAFAQALAQAQLATTYETGDVLGDCFMGLQIGDAHNGQFFTPYDVAKMMALMTVDVDEIRARHARGDIMTFLDPCVGAGSLSLAPADVLASQDALFPETVHFSGIDIDQRCCWMAYIQLTMRNTPAIIVHGNALSGEVWDTWKTPAHIAYDWDARLARKFELPVTELPRAISHTVKQLSFFEVPEERAS